MPHRHHLPQHPQRIELHNEIHARPPEPMVAPLALTHIVMLTDAAERAPVGNIWRGCYATIICRRPSN